MKTLSESVYDSLSTKLNNGQSILSSIEDLHTILCPSRKLRTLKLSPQQIFTQIYKHSQGNLKKLKTQILSQIQDNQEEDDQSQQDLENIEDQDINEDQYAQEEDEQIEEEDEEMDEEQMDEEEGDIQQNDYEMDQQDENFEGIQQDGNQNPLDYEPQDQEYSENDVGLYGQELDEEDMESYENQDMEDDPEFQRQIRNTSKSKNMEFQDFGDGEEDAEDEAIEQNFDHFREVQMENKKNEDDNNKTVLDKQIDRLEDKILEKKQWALMGQVKAKERPINSLLEHDLQFSSGIKYSHQIDEKYNEDLQKVIKQRILDQLFDDRVRYTSTMALRETFSKDPVSTQKSNKGLAELYELEFKNYLGLGESKNDRLKKEIMQDFKEVNYYLDSLSNLNFTPKTAPNGKVNKKGQEVSVVVEEKVPITMFQGQEGTLGQRPNRSDFESDKQIDKKGKRTKNKRIARQRKKEQMKKRSNRKIEYGGMTKHEVAAQKKISKNAQKYMKQSKNTQNFSKSNQFFKNMSQKSNTRPGKPNPNLSKMKI